MAVTLGRKLRMNSLFDGGKKFSVFFNQLVKTPDAVRRGYMRKASLSKVSYNFKYFDLPTPSGCRSHLPAHPRS